MQERTMMKRRRARPAHSRRTDGALQSNRTEGCGEITLVLVEGKKTSHCFGNKPPNESQMLHLVIAHQLVNWSCM